MNKITFLSVLLCAVTTPLLVSSQEKPMHLDTLIRKLGEEFIKDKQAVGLSIGVYTNGATTFYNFGSTTMNRPVLPTQHTVYEIGSITKTFVSFILANAVLENKVGLDDDIRKYLKESYSNLQYEGHPIKLGHLANTTALLPDWLPEPPPAIKNLPADSAARLKTHYYNTLSQKDFFHALHAVKLDTVPGTKAGHSNGGALLLAYILEGVYNMPLEKLLEKYFTLKYDMRGTAFMGATGIKDAAIGYTASGKEATYEAAMPYFKNAGGLCSNTNDMIRYVRILLDSANRAASLCLKKTVDIDAGSGKVATMRPDNTASPEVYSIALNWFKYQPEVASSQIWADGGTNGFNSYVVLYPHSNSGVVLLANKSDEKIFRALPGIAYEISRAMGQQ